MKSAASFLCVAVVLGAVGVGVAEEKAEAPKAYLDGTGPGWRAMTKEDFTNANCFEDTWRWEGDVLHCTGQPIGVLRTVKQYKNFELVVEWMHEKSAGNSGVFVWVPEESLKGLEAGKLPHGIEVQILDHGYAEQYTKRTGKQPDFFTTNGDVFAVGTSNMKPFPPLSPNGSRSFPSSNRSKGFGQWNHYYIRAINGEVRLWVNGAEVSGGTECNPSSGFLCLESEGSPIQFKNLRLRELP
jgi:hypothetical protein